MKTVFSIFLMFLCVYSWGDVNPLTSTLIQRDTFKTGFHINGKITDQKTNEPLLFCSIGAYQEGRLIGSSETDFDGNYRLILENPSQLESLKISLEVSYIGYMTQRIESVILKPEKVTNLDIQLSNTLKIEFIEIISCGPEIIYSDDFSKGQILTADQIRRRRTGG